MAFLRGILSNPTDDAMMTPGGREDKMEPRACPGGSVGLFEPPPLRRNPPPPTAFEQEIFHFHVDFGENVSFT